MRYFFFDIFDTLVLRSWSSPKDLFLELAQKLRTAGLINVSESIFVNSRVDAELNCRQKVIHGEITINEIYDNLATLYNWSKQQSDNAIEIELECELYCAHSNAELINRLNEARSLGYKIAYVSDMYLPNNSIKAILLKLGYWKDNDLLFVSGELKKNKATGLLFYHIIKKIKYKEIRHMGDNFHSDYKVPKKYGISAEWYENGNNNRYEKNNLYYPTSEQNIIKSKIEGISKIARLSNSFPDLHNSIIWQTSSNIISHLFVSYVIWILFEAERKNIKTLYFVARDGQILKKIADTILTKWNFNVQCKYLYASRQALHFPAIQKLDEEDLNWIFDPTDFLSIKVLFERVNLKPDDVSNVLYDNGFDKESWNLNLTQVERDKLKKIFLLNSVKELIINRAREYQLVALGYLNQEGVISNDIAIVDLGWRGRLQGSLKKLLISGSFITEPKGFYFKLFSDNLSGNPNMFSFLDEVNINSELKNEFLSVMNLALIESFAYADHDSTLAYNKINDNYSPIFREGNAKQMRDWGILIQQDAIVNYTTLIVDNFKKGYAIVPLMIEIGLKNYISFYKNPTLSEASVYGQFKISEHQTEADFNTLAPIYNLKDTIKLLLTNKRKWHNEWDEAVIKRNSNLFKLLTNTKIKNFIQKIKEKFIYN